MNGMDYLEMGFHDAVFIKDFGPWKEGYKPYSLHFNPFHCKLTEGNQNEELVNECELRFFDVNSGDQERIDNIKLWAKYRWYDSTSELWGDLEFLIGKVEHEHC
jgi:hypothetical protein